MFDYYPSIFWRWLCGKSLKQQEREAEAAYSAFMLQQLNEKTEQAEYYLTRLKIAGRTWHCAGHTWKT